MEKMADTDTGLILTQSTLSPEDHEGSQDCIINNNSNSSSSPRYSRRVFKKIHTETLSQVQI